MKNLKKLATLVALVTFATSFSLAHGATQPIEGSWGMRVDQNGFTMDMTFTVANNTLTLQNVCTFQGRSATAHVSAPASYDDRTLTVLGSARDDESQNGVNCNAAIQPDRMNYVVSGNALTFSHDGSSETFTLTRK